MSKGNHHDHRLGDEGLGHPIKQPREPKVLLEGNPTEGLLPQASRTGRQLWDSGHTCRVRMPLFSAGGGSGMVGPTM